MRRFDRSKFLRIGTIFIIAISLISAYLFFTSDHSSYLYEFSSNWHYCQAIYSNKNRAEECYEKRNEASKHAADQRLVRLLFLSFIMPIIYFGGIWLYRYLFPLTHNSTSEHQEELPLKKL